MIQATRAHRRQLARDNAKFPAALAEVPRSEWPPVMPPGLTEVWRSREFLVQVYVEPGGVERLSVCRAALDGDRWVEGIAWDVLQRLKRECGRGEKWAVEVFPADADVVNVANMRHLWVLPQPPPLGWHSRAPRETR